jgi:hypothetical protein
MCAAWPEEKNFFSSQSTGLLMTSNAGIFSVVKIAG